MGLKCNWDKRGYIKESELKSDQNGIEIYVYYFHVDHPHILKSDQNGIEIYSMFLAVFSHLLLKSDQNGIEIGDLHIEIWGHALIKIRPKWDWNMAAIWELEEGLLLKSDQNGIEIWKDRPPTRVSRSLKSDQNGIEIERRVHRIFEVND